MVEIVEPQVRLIAHTSLDYQALVDHFEQERRDDAVSWAHARKLSRANPYDESATLAEFAGRLCYDSFPGTTNPNITRIRGDQESYIANILKSGHGSVLEHISYTFLITDLSRIASHELVRHRAGTAISQESGRYVRPTSLKVVLPETPSVVSSEPHLEAAQTRAIVRRVLGQIESRLFEVNNLIEWDNLPFSEKKALTSWLRRMLPNGQATSLVWTANVRTLRHVIELRTAEGAEEEIREVFGQIARIVYEQSPLLFQDLQNEGDAYWFVHK